MAAPMAPAVLIVHTEPVVLDVMFGVLTAEHFEVDAASTQVDAEALMDLGFDLLIIDIDLPDNATEALADRADELCIPYLLTCGTIDALAWVDSKGSRLNAHPFDRSHFLRRIRQLLPSGQAAPIIR